MPRCLALACMAARHSRGRCRGAPRFRLCAGRALAAAATAAPAGAGLGRARLAGAAVAALPSTLITPHGSRPTPAVSLALHTALTTVKGDKGCTEDLPPIPLTEMF